MLNNTFTNKIVLITGASRGIGSSIAQKFGELGATVIGTATTESGAEKINQTFAHAKIKGCAMVLNVADNASIDALMKKIKQEFGSVQILINNAAITKDNLFLRMKDQEWNDVITTNLNGIFYLTKACIRDMLKSRFGRIINISSVVASIGNPGQVNYCASKAGVIGFSKALALEIASRNITVNCIAPGYIATDMTGILNDEQKNQILERIPMQKQGTPDDIAHAACFLSSPYAEYITGQTLHVNGGMFMN